MGVIANQWICEQFVAGGCVAPYYVNMPFVCLQNVSPDFTIDSRSLQPNVPGGGGILAGQSTSIGQHCRVSA